MHQLLERATIWICDRYENGVGLATVDADEPEEIETLLGYVFDFSKVSTRHDSLAATIVSDLCVFLGESKL